MMMTIPAETRGLADHGWLKSWHSFSFAEYYDPRRMGFGALRVINDDAVSPGKGFGTHPHRDMEIISIPLSGSLKHRDSEGNYSVIQKGEVQIMSAGTGIFHSEYNNSDSEEVRFLQIWILPKRFGIRPRYDQKTYTLRPNELTLVVSPEGEGSAVGINQDAWFSLGQIESGKKINYQVKRPENGVFIFVLSGEVAANGQRLETRDGLGISATDALEIIASKNSEVLLMDIPMKGMNS